MARVVVGDLPPDFDEGATQQVFSAYGVISTVKMLPVRREGERRGAVIDFSDAQEAQWIVTNLNGNIAEGLVDPVTVRLAAAHEGKAGKGEGKGWGGAGGKDGSSGASSWGGAAGGNAGSWASNGSAESSWPADGGWSDGSGYGKAGKGKGWDGKSASAPYSGKGKGKKGGKESGSWALLGKVLQSGAQPDPPERPEEQCVYIRGLPYDTTDLDLYKLFSVFGAIPPRGVKAMKHPDGTCTSVGFVDFTTPEAAQAAISALNGYELPDGKSLFLKIKNPHGSGKGGKAGKGKEGKGKQQGWQGDGGKGQAWSRPPAPGASRGGAAPALPPAPPPPPVRPATAAAA